jgi:hypothetical protein
MPGGSGSGKPHGRNELRRSSARILSGHTPLRSRARDSMHVYTRNKAACQPNLRKHGRRGFIGNAPIVGRSPQVTTVGNAVPRHVRYILRTPPMSTSRARFPLILRNYALHQQPRGLRRLQGPDARSISPLSNMILPSSMPITVRSSLLKNFCPRRLTFFVNRIRSPIDSAICFRSNTLNFGASSGGSCFSTPSFPRMTASS